MWCCWLPACSLDCLQQGRRWTSDGTCPPASSEVTLGFPLNSSTFTPLKLETSLSSFCFKAQLLYHPFSVNQDITCLAQLQVDSPSLIYLAISLCISVDYASVLSIFHIKFWATRKQEMCLGKFPPMQQSVTTDPVGTQWTSVNWSSTSWPTWEPKTNVISCVKSLAEQLLKGTHKAILTQVLFKHW